MVQTGRQRSGRVPWNWPGRAPEPERVSEGSGYRLMSDYKRGRLCPELFRGTLSWYLSGPRGRKEARGLQR